MRRRKAPALAMAGALVLSAVAACSGAGESATIPDDPADASGTVTMWINPINEAIEDTYWEPVVAAFEEDYPNVDVEVVIQPWENRDEQLTTAIAGNEGPDVVYLIPDQIPQYAGTNSLADVSDVIADDREEFLPNALEAMSYDDTLYGVPLLMSVTSVIANKNVLADAGISEPPTTWDEALADAAKLKQAGYYLTEYDASPDSTLNQTFYPFLWQAGGSVLSEDGSEATINSSEGVRALEFIKQLVDEGYVPKDPLTTLPQPDQSVLCTGEAALAFARSVTELEACPGFDAADWVVAPPLKDVTSVDYGAVGGLSVLATSDNQGAAKAWVQWLSAPERIKDFNATHHYYSPRESTGNLFADEPLVGEAYEYLDLMKPGVTDAPSPRELQDAIKPDLQAALLGSKDVEEALDDAADTINEQLARR
jgi:multiple sugar transport system substrate-binding protein